MSLALSGVRSLLFVSDRHSVRRWRWFWREKGRGDSHGFARTHGLQQHNKAACVDMLPDVVVSTLPWERETASRLCEVISNAYCKGNKKKCQRISKCWLYLEGLLQGLFWLKTRCYHCCYESNWSATSSRQFDDTIGAVKRHVHRCLWLGSHRRPLGRILSFSETPERLRGLENVTIVYIQKLWNISFGWTLFSIGNATYLIFSNIKN